MRNSDLIILALKNIAGSHIKGVLSVISVCIGIASVSLVSGIGWGVADQIEQELGKIDSNAMILRSADRTFEDEEVDRIKSSKGIKGAMPFVFEFGTLYAKTQATDAMIVGIDKDFTDIFDIETLYGIELGIDEVNFSGRQVIVDDSLARSLYYRTNIVGKKIQLGYGRSVREYEVVGVVESPKAGAESLVGQSIPAIVYIPYQTINEDYGENKVSCVAVACTGNDDSKQITDAVVRHLKIQNKNSEYEVDRVSDYTEMVTEITKIVAIMISCVAGISVIVGGIGMMSSMLSGVESRKAEIGVYMALGIRKSDILKMYVVESVIISAVGGGLGILISLLSVYAIKKMGVVNAEVNMYAMMMCFVGAILCGGIFGYLPAQKAADMDPIDAIRWE